ncbi:serine/threonine-protein kinase [Umezawaea beigongshangensis]|uniref:serine/threonine-protein kinase n=1 Tax=Umezawaea beigongshangensis TaxID=2780383 RepID=UPI0018F14D11|nr:serine/threonine-protein kinase [Umezawaea beigongshangensis]
MDDERERPGADDDPPARAPESGRTTRPVPRPARPEISLPGYADFRLIAQGGAGSVYRARQIGPDRDVAVKVLQVWDDASLARFREELETTVRLGRRHPHVVTVVDTGTVPDGRPCVVMEYYDQGSLHDRLCERGPLPVAEVVAAGTAVADALAFAHARGVPHRDVKPQNVLVPPASYVLADFAIARGVDAALSASLQTVSYQHASPQVLDGAAPAAADDLWSLGSTLFTLLDGRPPFAADDPGDAVLPYLARVRAGRPRELTRDDVPPELRAVITRCLRTRREDRFPDAAALRSALAAIGTAPPRLVAIPPRAAEPDSAAASPDRAPPREAEEPPRRRGGLLLALVVAVAVVGVAVVVGVAIGIALMSAGADSAPSQHAPPPAPPAAASAPPDLDEIRG